MGYAPPVTPNCRTEASRCVTSARFASGAHGGHARTIALVRRVCRRRPNLPAVACSRTIAALMLIVTVVTGCADAATAEDCRTLKAATAKTIDTIDDASMGLFRAVANLEMDEAQSHYRVLERALFFGFEDQAEDMLNACAPHMTAEELDALKVEVDEILQYRDDVRQWCHSGQAVGIC